MLIIGRAIMRDYPTPTRYYAEVCDDDRETVILSTLPCGSPAEAIAAGRDLAAEHVIWGGEDSFPAIKVAA